MKPVTTPTSRAVLSARGIRKTFHATEPPAQVLDGIDLTIGHGEFVAVMGASGSGKSTLLYTISGMDRPTAGQVSVDGHELAGLDDTRMSALRLTTMGFVFQHPYFLANLDIHDNVLLPALKAAKTREQKEEAKARAARLLERFEIGHIGSHGITEVSGGQLQRASLCRALTTEPVILFADEPTGALNSSMTAEVMDALTQAHRGGTTLVMVTHDPACAARADRVLYLKDGSIVDEWKAGPWEAGTTGDREAELLSWLRDLGF